MDEQTNQGILAIFSENFLIKLGCLSFEYLLWTLHARYETNLMNQSWEKLLP